MISKQIIRLALPITILFFFLMPRGLGQAYTQQPSYGFEWKRGIFDTSLCFPYQDTIAKSIGFRAGFVTIKPSNNVPYIYNGTSWQTFATGTGGTGTVTSVGNGYAIIGGPVTTTGSLGVDSTLLATRLRLKKVSDSLAAIIVTKGSGTVTNIGTGYGTLGGPFTTTGTLLVDTTLIGTKLRIQQVVDSLNIIIGTKGTGTITNLGTGYGILGGPVTTTGIILVDSSSVATRLRVQKAVDSLNGIIAIKGSGTVTSVSNGFGTTGGTITITGSVGIDTILVATRLRVQKAIDSLNVIIGNKGTVNSVATGYGLNGGTITNTGTLLVDTISIATRLRVQKAIDSLNVIIGTKGVGSVTSVGSGYGLSGGTITSTGTLIVDTTLLATKLRVQKGIDSLSALDALKGILTNPLSQFSSTTSTQLANTISDESGSGSLIFGTSPTLSNPVVGTQSTNDNTTKAASTAFVSTAISNAVAGINPAVAVQVATTTSLIGYTYNNGVSGVGASLTQTTAAIVVIDGYTLLLNDRVLIKDQTSTFTNGIYVITTLGTGIIPAVFTRAADYNQPSDINNTGPIPVINGNDYPTGNKGSSWQITTTVATIGTDALAYIIFTYEASKIGLTTNPLSQFASTTSAQLAGVISNETGTGVLVFGTSPALTTPDIGTATGTSLTVTTNSSARSFIPGYTTTATAGTTTTLTSTSTELQYFTGTSNQTVQLPSTAGLTLGQLYTITNNSTGVITINNTSATGIQTVQPGVTCKVTVISTGAETWSNQLSTPNGAWINYFSTSTILNFSSFTTSVLKYQIIGKTLFVIVNIEGVSNGTALSFTLPYNAANATQSVFKTRNNGTGGNGTIFTTTSSNLVEFATSLNVFAPAVFTGSGTKGCYGNLIIEIQ